ncbi:MAG TPA: hypothetical protein VKR56_00720 [Candidatus Cybelea sp.]|nr:hypothetical protein [Candidatus Cybelea sp.]
MKVFVFSCALVISAALLAGCGGSQPPIGAPGVMPQTPVARVEPGTSWMLPEAKGGDLLYVATGDNVYVLSYPHGKFVGDLGVSSSGLCSNREGDVFIFSGYGLLEYAHGGTKPIRTLHSGDIPLGCAVDPATNDLAVTQEASGAGEVAIFRHSRGTSTWYRDPDIYMYGLCGYDDRGNLFVDGSGSGNFIAELPKGSSTFANYALGKRYDVYGGIQWDGRHMTLANPTTHQVFRLRFGKQSLKVTGATHISGWQNNYSGKFPYIQAWIQDGTFIAQSSTLAEIGLWSYPAGGKAVSILGPFEDGTVSVYGITISLAPPH